MFAKTLNSSTVEQRPVKAWVAGSNPVSHKLDDSSPFKGSRLTLDEAVRFSYWQGRQAKVRKDVTLSKAKSWFTSWVFRFPSDWSGFPSWVGSILKVPGARRADLPPAIHCPLTHIGYGRR